MNYANTSRRDFLTSTLLAGAGFMVGTEAASVAQSAKQEELWPNGARLAVSFSLMFEAGGQLTSGAGRPVLNRFRMARSIYLQTVFLNTALQRASLSYDSDHY